MPKATVRPYYEQTPKEWAELFDRSRTAGPNARILLKGATVISVDAAIGDFDQGDVLIRGRRIEAVDTDLSAVAADGGAIVIEMGGMIVMPGIVDGHRHCWQNQFRRVIPDVDLAEYVKTLHGDFALEYRAHDIYVGNFLTMLTLLTRASHASMTARITPGHGRMRMPLSSPTPILAFAPFTRVRRPLRAFGKNTSRKIWFAFANSSARIRIL